MESPESWRRNQTQVKPWRMTASLATACSAHQKGAGQDMDTLPGSESAWLWDPSGSTKVSGYCENCSICLSRENFDFGSGLSREREAWEAGRMDPSLTTWLASHTLRRRSHGEPTSAWPCRGPGRVQGRDSTLALFLTSDVFCMLCIGLHLLLPSLVYARWGPAFHCLGSILFLMCFMLSTCVLLSSNEMSCLFPGLLFISHWSVTRAEIV